MARVVRAASWRVVLIGWPNFSGLLAMIFLTLSVRSEPVQIETAAIPTSLKSLAMSAVILSVPALGTPYAGPNA